MRGLSLMGSRKSVTFLSELELSEEEFCEKFYENTTNFIFFIIMYFLILATIPFIEGMMTTNIEFADWNNLVICRINELIENKWTFKEIQNISKYNTSGTCVFVPYNYSYFSNKPHKEVRGIIEETVYTSKLRCNKYLYDANTHFLEIGHEFFGCDVNMHLHRLSNIAITSRLFGFLVIGLFSDIFGRKHVGFILSIIWSISMFLFAYCFGIFALYFLFFVFHFISSGLYICVFVLFVEVSNTNAKYFVIFDRLFMTFGNFLMIYLKTYLFDWRQATFVIGSISIITLCGLAYMVESTRWLLVVRQKRKAYCVLKEMGFKISTTGLDEIQDLSFRKAWINIVRSGVYGLSKRTLFKTNDQIDNYTYFVFLVARFQGQIFSLPFYFFTGKRITIFLVTLFCGIVSTCILLVDQKFHNSLLLIIIMQISSVRQLICLQVAEVVPSFCRSLAVGIILAIGVFCDFIISEVCSSLKFQIKFIICLCLSFLGFPILLLPETSMFRLPNQRLYFSR